MKKNAKNWKEETISLMDKRIHELTTIPMGFTFRQIQRELELLYNLKSIVEKSTRESFMYQRNKLDRTIEILNKRYVDWLKGNIERKENPKSRAMYNTEVGLNHLRRQRRNVTYILKLGEDENN